MTIKIEKNKIRVHLAKKGKGCSKIRKEALKDQDKDEGADLIF